MAKLAKQYSPMTEASFYILLSLARPLHGYGIIKKVEEMTEGRLKIAAGTLYGALGMLLDARLIRALGEDEKNRRRKLYEATGMGLELLRIEICRLAELHGNGVREMEDLK